MLEKQKLLVLGVHTKSAAYPNTLFRIQFLKCLNTFLFEEINQPLTPPSHSNYRKRSLWAAVWNGCNAQLRVFLAYFRYIWRGSRPDIAYAPYPAILTAAFLSILPARLRPEKVILDGFISLYDTVVLDRGLLQPKSLTAKLLYKTERRAFYFADTVIVDTAENAEYLAELFKFPISKFVAIPLSTDETNFTASPYSAERPEPCKVLFIGTMIPLHGIHVIAETIRLLSHRHDIHFHLIGDGQDSNIVERILPLPSNATWHRGWKSSAELAQAIRSADICLGIFGNGDKPQRVCPYKIYAYAGIGRAIITGRTRWSIAAEKAFTQRLFALVEPNNSKALAEKIIELTENTEKRRQYANASSLFYQGFLSNTIAHQKLLQLLDDSHSSEQNKHAQA